jgi:hypothetical protein
MKEEMTRGYLKEAISNVMETMFFLPVQFLDGPQTLDQWFSGEGRVLEAFIEFKGSRSGSVSLFVPGPGLEEMSANILGLDANESSEEQVRDTLKEAINMMAGQMLSLLDGEGGFALGIPRFAGEWTNRDTAGETVSSEFLLFDAGRNHLAASFVVS